MFISNSLLTTGIKKVNINRSDAKIMHVFLPDLLKNAFITGKTKYKPISAYRYHK